MSHKNRETEDRSSATVAVDKWGIKYRAPTKHLGEEPPQTWREVWRQVNRYLMRIVSGIPRLLAEAVEGGARLARSTIPEEDADRIETAHVEADYREELKQEDFELSRYAPGSVLQSLQRIEAILASYTVQGMTAGVVEGPQGQPVIIIVRPELGAAAGEIIAGLIPEESEGHLSRLDELFASNIDELELSLGTTNCLKNANIYSLRDLVRKSEREMLETKDLSKKSLGELQEVLGKLGLSFGMDVAES